jgi:hypothetical protein
MTLVDAIYKNLIINELRLIIVDLENLSLVRQYRLVHLSPRVVHRCASRLRVCPAARFSSEYINTESNENGNHAAFFFEPSAGDAPPSHARNAAQERMVRKGRSNARKKT